MRHSNPIKATIKAFSAIVKQAESELKKMRDYLKQLHSKAKTESVSLKKKAKKLKKKTRAKSKKSVKAKVKAKVKSVVKKVTKKRKSKKK
jgi:hypothetical protein